MLAVWALQCCSSKAQEASDDSKFKLEGKVTVPFTTEQDWIATTRILLDGGQFLGFLKSDGSFSVNNVPSGSYVVEVAHPTYAFDAIRVDINSKGKMRARRLNNVQTSSVQTVSYPLRFKARGRATYFQQREQWRITDILMNPMVMMMLLPFLVIMVLPKLMNTADPEAQKEMQNQMKMFSPKENLPDLSEMFTSALGGSSSTSSANKRPSRPKPPKRRS
ncbi:ER membrane protein complex subunit 7 [Lamellibrachia satsuma]|nr:ER membrane protein complex subunit 7 [Lamellibrachia satsuma]